MTVEEMVETILRPLVQADGGDVEFVSVEGSTVVLRVSGQAAYGAGAQVVRQEVIEPAIRKVLANAEIEFQKVVPKARRRTDPGASSG